eukprot:CAMPEP_0202059464 /NCGR_PEP_ID=MMETSP0963-20130614/35194_1 /ASSEMBLY_ACC=CAM_ASM_000494 /TAXON_ID=4773 /ORGANISM="Schizochytrium aggregatum, Strain ATCC28209" /LENGTH=72 /DNA_ID=CAMNT_0048625505 /DNA_START=15 /DNA_END=229 /DNA_ORIENTATION=+
MANRISGFGRVHLTNTLKVNGNEEGQSKVFLHGDFDDMPVFTANGERFNQYFEMPATAETPFKVTLVWADVP